MNMELTAAGNANATSIVLLLAGAKDYIESSDLSGTYDGEMLKQLISNALKFIE